MIVQVHVLQDFAVEGVLLSMNLSTGDAACDW